MNVSYRDRYFLSVARSGDYLGIYENARQYEAGVALPWIRGIEFGVNAGRFRSRRGFEIDYSYWDAGLSRAFGRLAVDFRFHDTSYGRASLLGNKSGDTWVASLTYALLPVRRQAP